MILILCFISCIDCSSRKHKHQIWRSPKRISKQHKSNRRVVRPHIKIPKKSRFQLIHKIGREIAPHDLSFINKVSHEDRDLIYDLIYRSRAPIERLLAKYSEIGKLEGDYLFDESASDLILNLKNQKKAKSIASNIGSGLMKGLTK